MSASLAFVITLALGADGPPPAPMPLVEPIVEVSEAPANALTIEPLAVVFAKTIALEYERRIVSGVSVAIGPVVTLGQTTTGGEDPQSGDYIAWGLALSTRFYPWSVAPEGPFIGPFGQVAWTSAEAGDVVTEGFGWSVGGLAGYTWVLGKYFVFSVGAGAAWLDMAVEVDGESRGKRGVYPSLRLAIGGAF